MSRILWKLGQVKGLFSQFYFKLISNSYIVHLFTLTHRPSLIIFPLRAGECSRYCCYLNSDVRRRGRTLRSVNLLVSLGNCVHFASKVTDSCKRALHTFSYSRGYFIDWKHSLKNPDLHGELQIIHYIFMFVWCNTQWLLSWNTVNFCSIVTNVARFWPTLFRP